nr:hypothetical protein [Tanacetum cinerariifolium]
MTGNLKLLINFVWKFLGTVRFGNDHVAAILGFGNHSTNIYTINLHEMASTPPICFMACASSTKSWLWHQRLSHLNFDIINDLAKNDLVFGLPNFKYHKEHLCSSCEQGKSKKASHPPKPVPNSKQRLHLLHMDLCGPMRIASINGKRPDIAHASCLCARYQAKPTEKHLKEVKRIFCYLRRTVNTGLRYTKDSGFELTGFSDADYARCKDTLKNTSDGAQFLGEKL